MCVRVHMYAYAYVRMYIHVHFCCSECCVHFGTGVLNTSACVGVYIKQVFFDINIHICDTPAAGCAHMFMCIYICMCIHMYIDTYAYLYDIA